jgi:hypothetical protein
MQQQVVCAHFERLNSTSNMHYDSHTVTLDRMHTGMWLIAGTAIVAVVSATVTWYYVRTAEAAASAEADIVRSETKRFEARVKGFESTCKYLKNVEDVERIMDK